jgi:hypothetical protein
MRFLPVFLLQFLPDSRLWVIVNRCNLAAGRAPFRHASARDVYTHASALLT